MMVHEDLGSPQTALAAMFLTHVLLFLPPVLRLSLVQGATDTPRLSGSSSRASFLLHPLSPLPAVQKGSART